MGAIEIEVDPLPCKWCDRPLEQRRWWALKRFCNRWHRLKYWAAKIMLFLADI
ncbi:hypothetical protein [Streptomyces sp. NPDC057854]|uniref:hypothetical protein n=1 Tax=unclassified Streptomyces TaxID=2593676 RepID=UPI00367F090A